jgi:hypothetical protein
MTTRTDVVPRTVRREMRIRITLLWVTLWMGHSAVCQAAPPAEVKDTTSSNCASPTTSSTPLQIDDGHFAEYPGIAIGQTMNLGRYPNTSNDWQITFPPTGLAASQNLSDLSLIHLVCVPRGGDNQKRSINSAPTYWDQAAGIMLGNYDYYGGVGYVATVPTLAVLVIYDSTASKPPKGTKPKPEFCLVLVKLDRATHSTRPSRATRAPPACLWRQGGVIHGHEN